MNPSRTIKYKALFLLVSFSLNTVVGLACSLGFDMDFNARHHDLSHGDKEHHAEHNEHAGGHGRHQQGDGKHDHPHQHQHRHAEGNTHHKPGAGVLKAAEDEGCCNNFVVGFQNLDKQNVEKFSLVKPKGEQVSFVFPSSILISRPVYTEPVRNPPKIPDHHLLPDVRVLIQSFQI